MVIAIVLAVFVGLVVGAVFFLRSKLHAKTPLQAKLPRQDEAVAFIMKSFGISDKPIPSITWVTGAALNSPAKLGWKYGNGYVGGLTLGFDSLMVAMPDGHTFSSCGITHEFKHIHLGYTKGDFDAGHLDPCWLNGAPEVETINNGLALLGL